MQYIKLRPSDFVCALNQTYEDWAIGDDWQTIIVFADGRINGVDRRGVTHYGLDGNHRLVQAVVRMVFAGDFATGFSDGKE